MADEYMKRQRDVNWCPPNQWPYVHLQILMDIRAELKALNAIMHCSNTQMIPHYLKRIAANTAKPRKKKA